MLRDPLNAQWIGPNGGPRDDLGCFVLRRIISPGVLSRNLRYWISADQRFKLFLDGKLIHIGPGRGDAQHWFAESGVLAVDDPSVTHTLVALVWNFGRWAPMAQCTVRTGFFFDCDGLSTPTGWEIATRPCFDFSMQHSDIGDFYIDIGPGEIISQPFDIEQLDTLPFVVPNIISQAEWQEHAKGGTPWMLIPRSLPSIAIPESQPLAIQAGQSTLFELDLGVLRAGYPQLAIHNPTSSDAQVFVTFAEARQTADGTKGHRDDAAGTSIRGIQDTLIVPAGQTLDWEPLWWRTARYIAIHSDQPIDPKALAWRDRGSSLVSQAQFQCSEPWVEQLQSVAIRTLNLCAEETYFDCPYYEQLQYAGDTRIQALCGYFLSPDRGLQRQAISQFHWSVGSHGFTQSRYPSRQPQVIPPFSLFWILMVFDAWMHDADFDPRPYLHACQGALDAFSNRMVPQDGWTYDRDPNFWGFCDWVPQWRGGVPPGGLGAEVHRLTFCYAAQAFAKMTGGPTPEFARPQREPHEPPSEHAEALWRCIQREAGLDVDPWPNLPPNAARCTYYFDFYRHEAQRPNDYLAELGPWRKMLDLGLTTFAENPEPTRSDCHGWSAHPVLGLYRHVAGIRSAAPGWSRVAIEPRLGSLPGFRAEVPHPVGLIAVEACEEWVEIQSPVPGTLTWADQILEFDSGTHRLVTSG